MSIATAAPGAAERRLPKVIDARTHGILDYCHAALFFGVAIYYGTAQPAGHQGGARYGRVPPSGVAAQ